MTREIERLMAAPSAQAAREAIEKADVRAGAEQAALLVPALSSRCWDVRKLASERLAALGPEVALPPLERILNGELDKADENGLFWAIQTLVSLGQPAAGALTKFLPHCPAGLRVFAIRASGQLRPPGLVPVLVELLASPDYATREEAAKVLADHAEESVAAVRQLLNTGSPDQKFWAFKILAKVMGVKAVEPLSKILRSPVDEQQGAYALGALKEIHHPSVIPTLVWLLGHESWYYRAEAAEVLTGLGKDAVPELRRVLEIDNPDIRFWGMKILREILGGEVVPILEPLVRSGEKSTRYSAVITIGGLRDGAAARMLIRCFEDEVWIIRKIASDNLVRMGDFTLKYLLDNLKSDSEESLYWTLVTLGKIGDDAAEPFVAKLLEHPSKTIRLHAVDALTGIGSEAAAADLVRGFKNSIWTVRQRCCEALARLGMKSIKTLLRHVDAADGDVAYWTERALGAFEEPGLPKMLADLKRATREDRAVMIERLDAQPAATVSELLRSPSAGRDSLMRLAVPTARPAAPESAGPAGVSGSRPRGRRTGVALFEAPRPDVYPMTMDEILLHAQKCGASDLHMKIGTPPLLRIHGSLTRTNFPSVTDEAARVLVSTILTDQQKHVLAEELQLDLSYEVTSGCRFRINIYKQTRGLEAACRYIEPEIPGFRQLGLPEWVMQRISSYADGLIIVTGPTGSGKSTTIAAIIDYINRHFSRHIITIEDPIEYVHENLMSYISYREVGLDVHSFPLGLRGALREDPDVILIGELRDKETISTALTLAGTGHLVLTTFHTASASQTMEQLIDFYPTDQQTHVRRQLAFILRAIVSQRLFPRADGRGRVPAVEILLSTNAVRNLLREGNTQQLYSIMQANAEEGMSTFDASLMELVGSRQISYEDAIPFVLDLANFKPKGHPSSRGVRGDRSR